MLLTVNDVPSIEHRPILFYALFTQAYASPTGVYLIVILLQLVLCTK